MKKLLTAIKFKFPMAREFSLIFSRFDIWINQTEKTHRKIIPSFTISLTTKNQPEPFKQ